MAIKTSLGKLTLSQPFELFLPSQLQLQGVQLLPIALAHVIRVARLPFYHRDPFDRLLVAQSLEEGLPLVSHDSSFDAYQVQRVW